MKAAVIGFVFGLVAAVVASLFWYRTSRTPSDAPGVPPMVQNGAPAEASGVGESTDAAVERLAAELEAANQQLLVDLMQARSNLAARARVEAPAAPAPTPAPEAPQREGMNARMQEMMQAAVRQQIDGRISRMKRHLNLTPEQEASIRALLEGQRGASMKMASRFLGDGEAGGESAVDPAEMARLGNVEERIRELLTPEQLAGYETLQEEERVTNARLVANSEMLQMQQSLGLSLEQQDKLYAVLYEQARGMLSPDLAAQQPAEAFAGVRGMIERKLAAVEQAGVLSAEQMQQFREMQEQQMRMIEAFVPKAGGAGDGAVPGAGVFPTPP